MSKQIKKIAEETVSSYGNGFVMFDESPERLVGMILEIIETLGLSEKQENSIKHLIRREIYYEFRERGVYILPDLHTKIRKKLYEQDNKNSVPGTGISLEDIK